MYRLVPKGLKEKGERGRGKRRKEKARAFSLYP
jgi:hypothetical protein